MGKLFEYIDTLSSPYEAFTVMPGYDGFPVHSHWHYYMEIIIILEGRITVYSDKDTYVLQPGDVFVFCPKSIHSITSYNNEDFKYGVLKFDIGRLSVPGSSTPSLRLLFESAANTPSLSLHFTANELPENRIVQLFYTCNKELDNVDYGYDMILHSSLCAILIELIRILKKHGFNTDSALAGTGSNTTIETITEYIDVHSSDHIVISDLADMCNMSYSYFAKSFKQIYGRSCKEYLEFIRISKAEDLLLYTDFDLTYISLETGFSDCSHLIKTFKKWKGITPKQYRIKRKNGQEF
ncbi:MAG: helix-turn-helix domain-containing protein [Lachnospiraceae bacterium]